VTPDALVRHVVGEIGDRPSGRLRVAIDGHPGADPRALADALVDPLRAAGRPVVRVHAQDFLRPASIRLQHGRHDPDAFFDQVDVGALTREVLDPLGAEGDGRYLPTLWDPALDRATRAPYEQAPPGAVLLLDGALLLGRWLELDLTVHLALKPSTRERRTAPEERWALPAYDRYDQEALPEESADIVVRLDDPRRPALVVER